jgi:hypothetical protein
MVELEHDEVGLAAVDAGTAAEMAGDARRVDRGWDTAVAASGVIA